VLVAVVGPSGAGKDTLMAGARAALAGEPGIHFIRRAITRPAAAGGEDHAPMTQAEFATARAAGRFALSWEAHGLFYGVPAEIEAVIARHEVAVANLSRRALAAAARLFPLRVVEITASPAVLSARLGARGRETADDIAARLAREAPIPTGLACRTIVNDGAAADGIAALAALLRDALTAARN